MPVAWGDARVALYLREHDVRHLLTVEDAIAVLERAFADLARGRADNRPRARARTSGSVLHAMAAAWEGGGVLGFKAYASGRAGTHFLVGLFDAERGELVALLEADWLGRVRTGAASGLATRYMAREDAATLGVFGTGRQAETQVLAVCAVRPIRRVRVYGRDPERRRAFCRRLAERVPAVVEAAEHPEAVLEADVVCTVTTAREPLFDGRSVRPGTHVNAAGANVWLRREVDDALVERASVIAVDDLQQARAEAGDLLWPAERGRLSWHRVVELGQIVAGRTPGRIAPDDVTLFCSQGIAVEDVAVAAHVVALAREAGMGERIAFDGRWPE